MFYKLDPEVAGHLGSHTIMDPSSHPPIVHSLHYELDGWPADDLLTTYPCFIVTKATQDALERAKPSGCRFAPVEVTTSEQFEELYPGQSIPSYSWLQITGTAGRDDLGTTVSGGSLIVSERIL